MLKKFFSITVTVVIISIVVGYAVATITKPNGLNGNFGKISSKVAQVVTPSTELNAHKNAEDQAQSTCTASRCHGSMRSDETPWHRMHLSISLTKFECSTCHKKVTTGLRSMAGKVNIDRKICLKCHRQKFTAFLPQHKRPDWVKLHKTLETVGKVKQKCFMCHNQQRKELDFCKQCHKKHQHSKSWIFGGHGKKARKVFDYVEAKNPTAADNKIAKENKNFLCVRCHEKKQWCTWRCHQGAPLPHNIPKWSKFWKDQPNEPKWRKVHFKVALKVGLDKCKRCHRFNPVKADPTLSKTPFHKEWKKKEFCQQCHHKFFYEKMPTLNVPWATKKGGMQYVKKQGSVRCWKCHDLDFCVYCHTKNEKPPYMNFGKENKSSNYKPIDTLFKEIEDYTWITKPPNFYTYYNNVIPVERLYPIFDERGFFKRNITDNRTTTPADGLTPRELLPPGQTKQNLGEEN